MRFWTEEEEKILTELWENPEVEIDDIAKVLSRTYVTVEAKARKMKLSWVSERRKPKIDYELYRKLKEVVPG